MMKAYQSKIQKIVTWLKEDYTDLTKLPDGIELCSLISEKYNKEITIGEITELEELLYA